MSDELLTYDDIPLWSRVYLRGKEGWVTDKGPDVSERTQGNHLEIEFTDEKVESSPALVKESLVNRYLEKKKRLWVDWSNRMTTYTGDTEKCRMESQQ